MSNSLQYTLSLNDAMSAKLKAIGISSDGALSKFAKLEQQTKDNKKLFTEMGSSIGSLKSKLDLLKAEREWIPSSNLQSLKKYNVEIHKLEREITKLDNVTGGSKFKKNLTSAFDSIPFASTLLNPVVATGAALFKSGQMAYSFDRGMAKINTTAQLTKTGLSDLKKDLLGIDPKYVDNWSALPDAYEKIISQTEDVGKSTDILKSSLIAAKAGFTEVETVSGAVARSMSLIKDEGVNATKVLDTFFAAKRVGAGEFEDFARYIPGLIASGDALGVKYKEVAGMFAYMTGKGQSAERSAVLMENAFSAMGKTDVRDNLSKEGINIFDEKGAMRSMNAVFGDFSKRMDGMSNEGKASFLEKMGLTDKEARSAFIVMSSDMNKLGESMSAVNNSTGEMNKAFENSRTAGDRMADMYSKIQQLGISLGGAIATVLNPALQVASWVIGITADGLTWLFDGIASGNPYVIALVASVTAFHIAMNAANIASGIQNMWLNILIVKEKLFAYFKRASALATGIATAATWAWEMAVVALNAAWAISPIGMITIAAVALGAAVYGVTKMMEQGTAAEKLAGEVKDRALSKSIEQRTELELLFNRLKLAKAGTDEYKNALKDLEAAYPGILAKYDLQNKSMDKLNAAHRELLGNILKTAEAEAKKELLTEKMKRIVELQDKQKDITKYTTAEMVEMGYNKLAGNRQEYDVLKDEVDALSSGLALDQMNSASNKVSSVLPGSSSANSSGKSKELGKATGRANEAITSGGQRTQNININFKNVVETVSIVGKNMQESVKKMEADVADGLLRAINMAITTAG